MNHLLADDSHEISTLIWFLKVATKVVNVCCIFFVVFKGFRVLSSECFELSLDSLQWFKGTISRLALWLYFEVYVSIYR